MLLLPPLVAILTSLLGLSLSLGDPLEEKFSPRLHRVFLRRWKDGLVWSLITYLIAIGPSLIVYEISAIAAYGVSCMIGLFCGMAPDRKHREDNAEIARELDGIVAGIQANQAANEAQEGAVEARNGGAGRRVLNAMGMVLPIKNGPLVARLNIIRDNLVIEIGDILRKEIEDVARNPVNRGAINALYEETLPSIVDKMYQAGGSIERGVWLRLGCLSDNISPCGYLKVHNLMRARGPRAVRHEIKLIRTGRRKVQLQFTPGEGTEAAWADRDWFRRNGKPDAPEICRHEVNRKLLDNPRVEYKEHLTSKRHAERSVAELVRQTIANEQPANIAAV